MKLIQSNDDKISGTLKHETEKLLPQSLAFLGRKFPILIFCIKLLIDFQNFFAHLEHTLYLIVSQKRLVYNLETISSAKVVALIYMKFIDLCKES